MSARLLVIMSSALVLSAVGCRGDESEPDPEPPADDRRPVNYVDPLIGSGGVGFGIGAAFPGPTVPFGHVRLGPDTSLSSGAMPILHCGGYYYTDTYIKGFSHIHLHGIGAPEFANILFMPTLGMDEEKTDERGYRSMFFHEDEEVAAGYYAVTLDDTDVRVELTSTTHAAMQRYTYPASDEAVVVIDLSHTLEDGIEASDVLLDPGTGEISGHVFNNDGFVGRVGGAHFHFVSRFDRLPTSWGTWSIGGDDAVTMDEGGTVGEDERIGAWFAFETADGEQVQVKTGISVIDLDHARANLDAEIGDGFDFDAVREAAVETWNEALSVVEVTGGTEDQRTIFYTGLYHAMLMPTTYTEAGGDYLGFDNEVHTSEGFTYYTDLSLWDTFRTEHPLLTLIAPERQTDMLISMEKMLQQGGGLPIWPLHTGDTRSMIGTPADQVIAGSYLKGLRGYDAEAMLDDMIAHATGWGMEGGRDCMEPYLALGYVPMDECDYATSRTLEFAYNDFAVAQLAHALGRTGEAEALYEQSRSFLGVWNHDEQFFVGRLADGSWNPDFDPLSFNSGDYTEATAWQYLWHVQHDVATLAELMGGPEALAARLDGFFEATVETQDDQVEGFPGPYYWHGNEPDIHAAYLFDQVGRPDLTQKWVRWIMKTLYGTGPDGIEGNDDCGTLSSWYVFSALGFFPIPATDLYLIGSPIFTSATVHLPGGDLTIVADGASPDAIYVQSAGLDGEPLDEPWIRHDQIAGGGALEFVMADSASMWGR